MKKSQTKLRYRFKTEPFSHQKKALQKILQLNGVAALFMEMGTGKTKVAIDWAGIGFYNHNLRRVLVVAPLSVLGVWPRQIRQHSQAPTRVFRLTGATKTRVGMLRTIMRHPDNERITYIIINYEGIWREPDRGLGIEDLLKTWQPDLVIFDESHRLKSPTSKQSKAAARIAKEAKQKLLLTGTPISKSPLDIFGQFRAMDPKVFGDNWYQFKFTYGVWGGFGHYQLLRYRNLEDLVTKIRRNSYRIKKEQCLDLPEKLFETVPVTLPDSTLKLYKQMAEEMIIEIEETHATASIVLTKLLRLSQITSGFVKDVEGNIKLLDSAKLDTCLDLLSDILTADHKVVIFVRFRTDIDRLSAGLDKMRIGHVILSGSVPQGQRDSIQDQFRNNPNTKVFISQIQAGSLGIDLSVADTAIFYGFDYNAANYWQAQDRLHRIGQVRNVTYYHLIVPKTIDSIVLKVLEQKGNVAEAVIHRPRALLGL